MTNAIPVIPNIGFGTWRIPNEQTQSSIEFAMLDAHFRHIDCASVYGNEKEVGEGLATVFNTGVKREDIFITSKLWNTDHGRVEEACRKTLSDLGLEYLDLYLIHWGVSFQEGDEIEPLDENGVAKLSKIPLHETWAAMESLVETGLVKNIGVANFSGTGLIDLLSYAKIKPLVNQVELHPHHAQESLVQLCREQDIQVVAYSPLGSTGGLTAYNDPILEKISKKHSRSIAQVILRWAIDRGTIPIPRSQNHTNIIQNIEILNFRLDDEDMKAINSMEQTGRNVDPYDWWKIPYFN